jgi:glutathione peroxidase
MRRNHLLAAAGALLAAAACTNPSAPAPEPEEPMATQATPTLFDLETRTLDGQPKDLGDYAGKVVLVVNTASACGLTPQYAGLQKLHETYSARGLVVIGFPCNQFKGQEPGSPAEIAAFCSAKYHVTFPLMEKVEVQPGAGQSPVYRLLTERTGAVPDWNFAKYLVSRDGKSIAFYGARTDPTGAELTAAIEALL